MSTELSFDSMQADLKAAMKSGDAMRRDTLRMLISALKNKKIDLRGELSADDILTTLSTEAKRRRESIDAFTQGGRDELAERERAELAIIEEYLPKQLSDDEVREMIATLKAATGATTKKEMGKIMGGLMGQIKGRFDGGRARELVTEALD